MTLLDRIAPDLPERRVPALETARLVAEELQLPADRWHVSFQSLFGKEEWLRPYTDETLRTWGGAKLGSVDVICPGFSADCLETMDEIGNESRELFEKAGGEHLKNGTCLNDHPKWIEAMDRIVREEGQGWMT